MQEASEGGGLSWKENLAALLHRTEAETRETVRQSVIHFGLKDSDGLEMAILYQKRFKWLAEVKATIDRATSMVESLLSVEQWLRDKAKIDYERAVSMLALPPSPPEKWDLSAGIEALIPGDRHAAREEYQRAAFSTWLAERVRNIQ